MCGDPLYHQDLWEISANVNNIFELFTAHSFTNSTIDHEPWPADWITVWEFQADILAPRYRNSGSSQLRILFVIWLCLAMKIIINIEL